MEENKLHVISKIFNSDDIRIVWSSKEEKYYISIVDVVGVLSESKDQQAYWRKLKQRLKSEGNETVTNCHALKLVSKDGKYRLTDVCDIEGMFRIIQSVPSKKVEPLKEWLAKLGSDRVDETFDPSIGLQRAIDLYRNKGYDEAWIAKRIKALQERKQLTDIWQENGVKGSNEYAILTNEIYKTWSGMSAKEYKEFKGLRKENLRDNMDSIELILTDLSEEATKLIAEEQGPKGLKENIEVAKDGGDVAKTARDNLERKLGKTVISSDNKLGYKHTDKSKQIAKGN